MKKEENKDCPLCIRDCKYRHKYPCPWFWDRKISRALGIEGNEDVQYNYIEGIV